MGPKLNGIPCICILIQLLFTISVLIPANGQLHAHTYHIFDLVCTLITTVAYQCNFSDEHAGAYSNLYPNTVMRTDKYDFKYL